VNQRTTCAPNTIRASTRAFAKQETHRIRVNVCHNLPDNFAKHTLAYAKRSRAAQMANASS
jgi:hypothetical protein